MEKRNRRMRKMVIIFEIICFITVILSGTKINVKAQEKYQTINEYILNQKTEGDYENNTLAINPVSIVEDGNNMQEIKKDAAENEEAARKAAIEASKLKYVSFNPYDITQKSNISVVTLTTILQDTNFYPLVDVLVECEEEFNINLFALLGLITLESAHGRSARAVNNNNISGYAVYNNSSRGAEFESWTECLVATARLLRNDYLNLDSKYYEGPSIWNVNAHYSASDHWADEIIKIVNDYSNKLK